MGKSVTEFVTGAMGTMMKVATVGLYSGLLVFTLASLASVCIGALVQFLSEIGGLASVAPHPLGW